MSRKNSSAAATPPADATTDRKTRDTRHALVMEMARLPDPRTVLKMSADLDAAGFVIRFGFEAAEGVDPAAAANAALALGRRHGADLLNEFREPPTETSSKR